MSRRSVVSLTALVLFLGLASPASATSPDRVTFENHETFTDDFLTEACGTDVVVTVEQTVEVTLWRNDAGLVERELDRSPGSFVTWTSPDTGKSVRSRADLVSHWDYGTGAVVGGPVSFSFTGMLFHVPGAGDTTFAWREVSTGVVEGFDNGMPFTESGTQVSLVGHIPQDLDLVDAICGVLT